MSDREHEHEGTFAEGQEREEHHPERGPHGEFAEGLEDTGHAHEGTFAEGVEREEHHPEHEGHGSFGPSEPPAEGEGRPWET